MENAILNLPPDQEQMVWMIDFQGFNLSHISVKLTRETAHVLQDHYPERLGLAILYNPPKFFEPFFTVSPVDCKFCCLSFHWLYTLQMIIFIKLQQYLFAVIQLLAFGHISFWHMNCE